MALYQVKLYKDLLSSDGHPFHCLQSIVDVEADGPENAVKAVFQGMRGSTSDWGISVAPISDSNRTDLRAFLQQNA